MAPKSGSKQTSPAVSRHSLPAKLARSALKGSVCGERGGLQHEAGHRGDEDEDFMNFLQDFEQDIVRLTNGFHRHRD